MRASRDLYLDLLAASLTGSLMAEQWSFTQPPKGPAKQLVWRAFAALLRGRGIVLASPAVARARERGSDWPLIGESMVGQRRLSSLRECVETLLKEQVEGDLLEAGVWRGGAAIFMKGVLTAHGDAERTVWLADSFEGLPRPDPAYPADRGDPLWAVRELRVSLEEVRANFERYGLLDDHVRFLAGWFRDTLPESPVERLALLRIDADLYESTDTALRALYDRVSVGGYVIVDDYLLLPACRAAVDDFRRETGIGEALETVDEYAVLWRRAA